MQFQELIAARRSTRVFADRALEEEKLRGILEAANRAPSAGNLQAYEIYVARSSKRKSQLARAALEQNFISEAPVLLVFCASPGRAAPRYGRRGERLYSSQDATIACTFAMLAAFDAGLATVWIGAFDEEAVRRAADLPPGLLPVAMLPIGYACEQPDPTPRRNLQDLVHEIG
jgi:nitroreductase